MAKNATELWVEGFLKQLNCVGCLTFEKPRRLYFHSGKPVAFADIPITDIEDRLDYVDAWCDDCRVYRSLRARADGRLRTKREAAKLAQLSKQTWKDAPSRFFVVEGGLTVYKARFHREAKNAPCAYCRRRFHFIAMEFHHLLPKGGTVSVMAQNNTSLDSLIREMERCTLLCSNCHRYIEYGEVSLCLPLWRLEDHKEQLFAAAQSTFDQELVKT